MPEQGHFRPAGGCGLSQCVQIVFDAVHMSVGIEYYHAVKGGQAVQRLQCAVIAVPGDRVDPQLGGDDQGAFQVVQAVPQVDDGVGVALCGEDALDRLRAAVAVAQDQKFRHRDGSPLFSAAVLLLQGQQQLVDLAFPVGCCPGPRLWRRRWEAAPPAASGPGHGRRPRPGWGHRQGLPQGRLPLPEHIPPGGRPVHSGRRPRPGWSSRSPRAVWSAPAEGDAAFPAKGGGQLVQGGPQPVGRFVKDDGARLPFQGGQPFAAQTAFGGQETPQRPSGRCPGPTRPER